MNYLQAEQYLNDVPRFTTKNPPEATRGFYDFLQEKGYAKEKQLGTIIHVAGTNGKGSVCAFLDSVCRESGYHVGLFTSPHLVTTRERFAIDGHSVSEAAFVEAFDWLETRLAQYHEAVPAYQPTYFERLFFMMFYLFSKEKVDVTVLETGLGGRLDATNVVRHPAITVITEIGYDHMAYLGDTLEAIASEKAGIIKAGVPLVYLDKRRETSVVLEQKARDCGAPCEKVSQNEYKINKIQQKCIDFSVVSRYYDYIGLTANTGAAYQAENAALAIRAAEVLAHERGLERISQASIRRGIAQMRWAGRMEEIRPRVYIDGAHNEDGIEAFCESVRRQQPAGPVVILFSAVSDKKYDNMIEMLCSLENVTHFCVTQIPNSRGVRIEELGQIFMRHTDREVRAYEDMREAYADCMRARGEDGTLYIVGSLYLAGLAEGLLT